MFRRHGSYDLSRLDRVLVIEAYGPWNLEAARYFDSAVRSAVIDWFAGGTWAMLAALHGEGIYTPESTRILKELHSWRVANGLRHIAIVHSPDAALTHRVTEHQFNDIYRVPTDAVCLTRYLTDRDEAFAWLRELGYILDGRT